MPIGASLITGAVSSAEPYAPLDSISLRGPDDAPPVGGVEPPQISAGVVAPPVPGMIGLPVIASRGR